MFLNEKQYRTFLYKLLIFSVTLYVSDVVIGKALKKLYFRQNSGFDYETTYAINETTAPLLVFGSSRANNIFDPTILEKELKLPCYNVGRYGEPIFYHYAVLKAVLKRYNPQIIILSLDAFNFDQDKDDYDLISVLLPYGDSHPELQEIINLKSRYERLKMMSTIYPYNSLLLPMISGNFAASKEKNYSIKGYIPVQTIISGPLHTIDYTKNTLLDTTKINSYTAFIKDCIKAKIKLYIVCPPFMINAIGMDNSIITAKKVAINFNIPFFDFSRDPFYTNKPKLFYDFRHLNDKGVALFDKQVMDSIKLRMPNKF